LYLVVDASAERVLERAEQALRGGVDVLQLWGLKNAPDPATLGQELRQLAQRTGVPLLVQDDVELARTLKADGVHLDREDLSPRQAREQLGKQAIIGVTCSTRFEKVLWAVEQRADYISFCSIFPSPSVNVCDLVPLELVRQAKASVKVPIFASGGITLGNARQVLEAGVDGLAISSGVLRASDPQDAARRFKALLAQFGKGRNHVIISGAVEDISMPRL
ncbi:thiamine phosphate synthase, partial [Candidatus Acetothermia bacterium]|nr:thiamine phosphate synthase [Candidatus Acetothermia bacterium]